MSTTNQPLTTIESQPPRDFKNLIIGLLVAGLIVLGGFFIFDHSKKTDAIQTQQTEIAKVSTEKSDIQNSFDASLARLDSMKTVNGDMQNKLTANTTQISKMKSEIRGILNKKNATAAELSRAKGLIAQLNGKISDMEAQIAQLTEENGTLKQDKETLTADKVKLTEDLATTTSVKEDLEKKVDVASTLNASNITITPIKVRGNGKEKVSTTAKRVDKLVVSFDVNNRIAQPGTTDVYVVVIGPDGKPVNTTTAGTFTTRDEGDMAFTAKLPVDIETSKTKNVEFAFAPGTSFQQGSYKIQIYQNGFLIGEGTRELKKGGLFS